jgi:predicted RNA-binding Zn ribbon-like protein
MAAGVAVMPLAELVELVNEWGTLPRRLDGRYPGDDVELTTLADDLHPVFAAVDAPARAALVTSLLQATGVRPELSTRAGELIEAWVVDDPALRRRAAAALALRHHLAVHPDRIGVCADHQCADVYVDISPAGRRRFCCLTCQNRARAAAFRRRHAKPR